MHASRSLFVVVPVAIFFVTSAIASPIMHVQKKHHAPLHNRTRITYHDANSSRRIRTKHALSPRSPGTLLDLSLGHLLSDRDGILSASNAFSQTADQANSPSAQDSAYQQQAADGLTSYRDSLDSLQGLFTQLAAEKGLANYDNFDEYETLLKDIVDASKDTFSDVDKMIDADPTLRPILGPIVYEAKCILDEILDITENVTDGLLNGFGPLLKPLVLSATNTMCRSTIPPVAGLCLPL